MKKFSDLEIGNKFILKRAVILLLANDYNIGDAIIDQKKDNDPIFVFEKIVKTVEGCNAIFLNNNSRATVGPGADVILLDSY